MMPTGLCPKNNNNNSTERKIKIQENLDRPDDRSPSAREHRAQGVRGELVLVKSQRE